MSTRRKHGFLLHWCWHGKCAGHGSSSATSLGIGQWKSHAHTAANDVYSRAVDANRKLFSLFFQHGSILATELHLHVGASALLNGWLQRQTHLSGLQTALAGRSSTQAQERTCRRGEASLLARPDLLLGSCIAASTHPHFPRPPSGHPTARTSHTMRFVPPVLRCSRRKALVDASPNRDKQARA